MNDNTIKFVVPEDSSEEMKSILTAVYGALSEKGYNPINQIVGYLLSEDPTYITNYNNARSLICKLDRDELLGNICVRGELSNYKVYPSGHHYFTLKDAEGALRCVMFRSAASKLRFRPESGMGVTAWGRVSVYPRDGAYQLYCEGLMPEGAGDLQVALSLIHI